MTNNPLLANSALPNFKQISAADIEPAITELLKQGRKITADVIAAHKNKQAVSWQSFMLPLALIDDQIERAWSPVSHLNSVKNNEPWQAAYDACLSKLSAYSSEMGQNKDLYQLCQQLLANAKQQQLSPAQQKALENAVRGFKLSGVDLEPNKQKRYRKIKLKLSKYSSEFAQNVLKSSNAWQYLITDKKQLAGLPAINLDILAENAKRNQQRGYLLDLQIPNYIAVMTYAENRKLRKLIYRAYSTRASKKFKLSPQQQKIDSKQWDNSKIIAKILKLRHQLAQLLGYKNYAALSLATKMAKDENSVLSFLNDLVAKSQASAQQEYKELAQFAAKSGIAKLKAWDVAYYSEKLQQQKFNISAEELKPWFSSQKVIAGLFAICEKLYKIQIKKIATANVWHPDVEFYQLEKNGQIIAQFYLDLYAREHKRGGAWMDVCASRFKKPDGLQIPVAYLTCNATPATAGNDALLTHDEVITLFHEFGHGLHHMLTEIDIPEVSGISGVEWDAVELPSQFMENYCWEKNALDLFAVHYQTNQVLPSEMFDKMYAAKNFQSALQMLRQLEFSIFDFKLHANYKPNGSKKYLQRTLNSVRQQVAVVKAPKFNRFAHAFSHIFAGGYAAGYYSYKWAEVLSADAYAKFEENGIFDSATGALFLETILSQGGSAPAAELFLNFRGREPKIDALLKHNGLNC